MVRFRKTVLIFISDHARLDIHDQNLTGPHIKYNRRQRMECHDQFSSLLSSFQPAVAWLGLIGCLFIVLIFNSARLWNGDITVKKFAVAYTAVIASQQTTPPFSSAYQSARGGPLILTYFPLAHSFPPCVAFHQSLQTFFNLHAMGRLVRRAFRRLGTSEHRPCPSGMEDRREDCR